VKSKANYRSCGKSSVATSDAVDWNWQWTADFSYVRESCEHRAREKSGIKSYGGIFCLKETVALTYLKIRNILCWSARRWVQMWRCSWKCLICHIKHKMRLIPTGLGYYSIVNYLQHLLHEGHRLFWLWEVFWLQWLNLMPWDWTATDRELILSISRQKTDCVYYHDRKLILSIITIENWFCLLSRQKTDWSIIKTENWVVLSTNCAGCSAHWSDIFTKLFSTYHFGPWGMKNCFWCWIKSLQDAVLYSFLSIGLSFAAVKINEAVKFFCFIWCYKWCYQVNLLSTKWCILKWRYFLAEIFTSIPSKGNWIVVVEIFSGYCLDPCVMCYSWMPSTTNYLILFLRFWRVQRWLWIDLCYFVLCWM